GAAALLEHVRLHGEGWRNPVPPAADLSIPDPADDAWVESKLTPHPLKTLQDPLILSNPAARSIPGTYIYCSADKEPGHPIDAFVRRARERGWRYRALATGHDAMVIAPHGLSALLLEAAY